MANSPWTDSELEATVDDYLSMLVELHLGKGLNKAQHNRALQKLLSGRTHSSVDFKHRNISAVLHEDGLDYLDGYLPAYNYQARLRHVIHAQLLSRPDVAALIRRAVGDEVVERPAQAGAIPALVRVPRSVARAAKERYTREARLRIVDFDALEMRNRSLGAAGELAVLAFEEHRLRAAGKRTLADRIEHVSKSQGDGLGFDIRSFEVSGTERWIEVKTTRRAELTPFYVTLNEIEVSRQHPEVYHLYRLFRFERDPKLFILRGDLSHSCRLEPMAYRAEVA